MPAYYAVFMFVLGGICAWLATKYWLTRRYQARLEVSSNELIASRLEAAQLRERATQIPELVSRLSDLESLRKTAEQQVGDWREQHARAAAEVESHQRALNEATASLAATQKTQKYLQEKTIEDAAMVADLKAKLEAEQKQLTEKLGVLNDAKASLSDHFKILANEIFDSKSEKFTEHNKSQIDQILEPLKGQIKTFQERAEAIQLTDTQQQAVLRAELGQMKELNLQMSQEAHALATALRGQSKLQGNWGELVLENVLERSGLRNGKDFQREVSFSTEEGRRRPDVVIYLPQDKHIVIDAKVSLNAYTRYVNSESDIDRSQALKEHVAAISSRIKELSDKSYFDLPGLNAPEVVFMFIPIESAFVEALRGDESLFQMAIEKNILVATPTTLLTSLNIVRQLWRFEEQNLHSAELAEKAAKIHKKLNNFLQSMQKIGSALDSAKSTYAVAFGQLYSGRDNLIKQASDFTRLGVSVQARLPQDLVDKASLELEYIPSEEADSTEADDDQ